MKQGSISNGNAGKLEYLLWTGNVKATARLLESWKVEAELTSCDRILISAEALVHQIALQHPLATLIESARQSGFKAIRALGFFRSLVDHALSTYKHRAKLGRYSDVRSWIENNYETPVLLQRLLDRLNEQPNIHFTLRSFRKDGEWMKQAFFGDWLGVELPAFNGKTEVNTSLSLSEIKILQGLRSVYPLTLDVLVRRLQAIPTENKAKDKSLEDYTKTIFFTHLKQYRNLLNELSFYFKEGENTNIGDQFSNQFEKNLMPMLQLSPEQWQVMEGGIAFLSSREGGKIYFRRKVYPVIKFLKYSTVSKEPSSVPLSTIYAKGVKIKTIHG